MSSADLLTLALALFAYILGSVPFGLIAARLVGGPDPRSSGSGNIGATNVSRTSGKPAGLITLFGDIGKGALPALLALNLTPDPVTVSIAGLSAFLGHLFPVFLKLKGGKGVATACGVMAVVSPMALFLSACVFLVIAMATGYVSIGSISAALSLPVFLAVLPWAREYVPLGIAIAVLVLLKHRENIKRLRQGTENRFRAL
jgi:glycerol-3-phosphate acyltransferase PlsY